MKKNALLFLSFVLFLLVSFLVGDFLYPLDTSRLYRKQSLALKNEQNITLRMQLSADGYWRFDTKIKDIPPLLKSSVLLFEDRWFYYHFGINPISIFRAFINNIKNKKTIGASTITMQLSRMMQRRKRSYKNKLIEMFNALQLEYHYSKDEILNFYFNLAPYGGNIEGIGAASYFYFHKKPLELTTAQIALLTTIPKNPNQNRLDKTNALYKKRAHILKLLHVKGVIDNSKYKRASQEPIEQKRFSVPFVAPQYTNLALKNGLKKIHLDVDLQYLIKKILRRDLENLKPFRVRNASAILIDNNNMEVVAYVGSNDFYGFLGQNDGVLMVRSPGSTLKPFVYANALDAGLITPKRELFDLPLHINEYEPENYFKNYFGIISAKEALQYSLNVPAVELNKMLDNNSLYETLKKADIGSLEFSKSYYGDALVLGGFGISLLDLTHLYTVFSHRGKLLPLKVAGKLKDKNATLMSKESSWIVSEILSDSIRPDFSSFWESLAMPKVAFKSGTSAGGKDLYTVGYDKDYTLGVWMGNFNGESTEGISGIDSSGKVVFEIFNYLNNKKYLSWMKKPKKVIQKTVCTDAILGSSCKNIQKDYLIRDINLTRSCSVLRGEVYAYLIKNSLIKSLKDFSKNPCFKEWIHNKPALISPYDKANITLHKELDKSSKIMIKCYSFKDDETIYVKVDEKPFIKTKSGEEIFVNLSKGYHDVSCVDSYSEVTTHKISILKE